MEAITVPTDQFSSANLAEIRQVSLRSDDDIGAVNDLIADGWRLLHIGHLNDRTVYVLGKSAERSRRKTGFLA